MRKSLPLSVTLLGLCTAVSAQGFTSPVGLEDIEGNGLSTINFAYYAACRLQYVDGNQRGTPRTISKMSVRQDRTAHANSSPRTVDISLLLSDADVSGGPPSTTFASNYVGTPTQVIASRNVSLPDFTQAPTAPPAPFNVPFLFDTPFSYSGTNDLLWEITGQNNSAPPSQTYYIDTATNGTTAFGGVGNFYYNGGIACVVPPNTSQFDIISSGAQTDMGGTTSMGFYALRGPVSSFGVLAIGVSDPNLVGVFCAPLRTSAEVMLPIMTDASGNIGSSANRVTVSFPFPGPAILYSQFAAFDAPNTALYLSDPTTHHLVDYAPPVTRVCYAVRNLSSASATSGSSSTFCIVALFE